MPEDGWRTDVRSGHAMKLMAEGLLHASEQADITQSTIYLEVMRHLGTERTVLDIGAGVGRLTVPLAESGCSVTAIEPSAEMLGHLRERLELRHLTDRVKVVTDAWPTDLPLRGEVALAAFVIQFAEDPVQFARAMESAASRRCVLAVHVDQMFSFLQDLWPEFHPDESPPRMPVFADLYPKLLDDGIVGDVQVFSEQRGPRLMDPNMAMEMLAVRLRIREDEGAIQRLRELLSTRTDAIAKPRPIRAAVISWQPRES